MKRVLPSALVGWFLNYARKLKHPTLFKWVCALFLFDLLIPDLVPFVDELLLGLATLFLASWRKRDKTETDAAERQEKVVNQSAVNETTKKPQTENRNRRKIPENLTDTEQARKANR